MTTLPISMAVPMGMDLYLDLSLYHRIMIMMHQEFLSMGRVIHITANIAIAKWEQQQHERVEW